MDPEDLVVSLDTALQSRLGCAAGKGSQARQAAQCCAHVGGRKGAKRHAASWSLCVLVQRECKLAAYR